MKILSPGTGSSLMRECAMRCSVRRLVLILVLVVGLRLLWLSLSTERSPRHTHATTLPDPNPTVPVPKKVGPLEVRGSSFHLDGKPFRIISGSFHYFRTHPEQWKDRLERMKAAYVNTVSTYVPWNLHERQRGVYNFAVDGWDLVRFIKLVEEMELHLIVRPGPYICAEWEYGGFPSWLLHDPNMMTRTSSYKPYMNHVKKYFSQLLPALAPFTRQRGGPIIAFQIENEFGNSKRAPDQTYLRFLSNLFQSHNIRELLFTSDNTWPLPNGTLPGVLATVNFNKNPADELKKLRLFQPDKPLMVAEFWPGWFDSWSEKHHTMGVNEFNAAVGTVLAHNASINLYMFVGGTNFGFWNGASYEDHTTIPTVTSYDYDSLISECGDVHPQKFDAFRRLLKKYGLITATKLQPIPVNGPKQAYGLVKVEEMMTMDSVRKLAAETVILLNPAFMEYLSLNGNGGQGYGYIIYRAHFRGSVVTLKGAIHDWAQVFVNGFLVKTIDSRKDVQINEHLSFSSQESERNCLEILVENMGRVNVLYHDDTPRKGFQGEVSSDVERIYHWEHIPLEFDSRLIDAIRQSKDWQPVTKYTTTTRLYRGSFTIPQDPLDTFLDMSEWGKGVAIVNGFLLGRYWNVGPQQTLYVPWPLLKKGKNEVIVFELQKAHSVFTFINKSILG